MSYQRKGIKRTAIVKNPEKQCKGKGLAIGFGCGKNSKYRTYGLCMDGDKCYYRWLTESAEGQKKLNKVVSNAPKIRAKQERKEMTEAQEKLRDLSQGYWKGRLQMEINKLARLIDHGQLCLARNIVPIKKNGGHVNPVGGYESCRYNLHNIFLQSVHSNHFSNDDGLMKEGLERVFSLEYRQFNDYLRQCPLIKLSPLDCKELTQKVSDINKQLSKNLIKRTPAQRIELRNHYNEILGIYHEPFSQFTSPPSWH